MRLESIDGKRLSDMSKAELIAALDKLWQSYVAVNRSKMSAHTLEPLPEGEQERLEDKLRTWFYGPHAT